MARRPARLTATCGTSHLLSVLRRWTPTLSAAAPGRRQSPATHRAQVQTPASIRSTSSAGQPGSGFAVSIHQVAPAST